MFPVRKANVLFSFYSLLIYMTWNPAPCLPNQKTWSGHRQNSHKHNPVIYKISTPFQIVYCMYWITLVHAQDGRFFNRLHLLLAVCSVIRFCQSQHAFIGKPLHKNTAKRQILNTGKRPTKLECCQRSGTVVLYSIAAATIKCHSFTVTASLEHNTLHQFLIIWVIKVCLPSERKAP